LILRSFTRLAPLGLLLVAKSAHAQSSTQERALASRLYDNASTLMASGQTAEACPKYAESERLDPQLGTLLHLGECYAKLGKTASAWTTFKEAADVSAERKDRREAKIRERITELEKTLSNLLIVVEASEPAGLELRQDGALVGRAGWSTPIPIDPGEHKITATAPGAKPRELSATIAANGQTTTLRLPAIEYLLAAAAAPAAEAPSASTSAAATPADSRSWFATHRKVVAGVAGGVGVVGVGVGAAFGLMAKSTYESSGPHCNGDHCDSAGHDYRQSAFGKALVSDVAFGVGAAALVGGAVLWLTAPKHTEQSPSVALVTPLVGPGTAMVSVHRTW
jgi:hypothetical protein